MTDSKNLPRTNAGGDFLIHLFFDCACFLVDPHDHWEDHRSSARLPVQTVAQFFDYELLYVIPLCIFLRVQKVDHITFDFIFGAPDQTVGFPHVHETAGDDVRSAEQIAGLEIDGDDNDGEHLLRKIFSVAEHDIADVPDADSIHEYRAGLDASWKSCAVFLQCKHVADFHEEDIIRVHAGV